MNLRFKLSKIIPVPMRSSYTVETPLPRHRESARWVQWRGRVWAHRRSVILT